MNKQGYTLLEVILFLAISSGLALVAFIGLGPRLSNVRFTDSVRGVEAQITRAIASARVGQNNAQNISCEAPPTSTVGEGVVLKPATPEPSGSSGQSQDCVFNGVQILIDGSDNTLKTYQLASRREKITNCNVQNENKALEIVLCYGTRAVGFGATEPALLSSVKTYELTNGLNQSKFQPPNNAGSNRTFVGYVVDPETNSIHTFLEDQESISGDKSRKVCYELNGRKASIGFSVASIEPKVEFNDEDC